MNSLEKSKQDLIAEIDKRISDKIIEQSNADLLKKLIINAETLTEAVDIAKLGTTYKRTGFHFDKRNEKMGDTVKYFKKNDVLSFRTSEDGLTHKLIVGDNYDALLNLLIQYRGAVDVIYIDPPYGKDSMGEFAQTNYDNAITRDNLLSMLYSRLVLAKQLLSDSGVIFCSIDDRNQAYVKGLFDEVFRESNFISCITRATGTPTGGGFDGLVNELDYILAYAKDKLDVTIQGVTFSEKDAIIYNLKDEIGKYLIRPLRRTGGEDRREDRPTMYYGINAPDGTEVFPVAPSGYESRWICGEKKYKELVANGLIEWKQVEKNGGLVWQVYQKFYVEDRKKQPGNLWTDVEGNKKATRTMRDIFNGEKVFDFPKPVGLITKILEIASNSDSIILDFFAGSGTTGQAVLELNKADGGKRQFILAQLNEITNTTPNGVVLDVTSKRLKRVMTGSCYDGTKDFRWLDNNTPLGDNLDVYDIATVNPCETSKGQTPFDVIDETLYGQAPLAVTDKIKWVCENFDGTQKKVETDGEYKRRIGGEG